MNTRILLAAVSLISTAVFAADLPKLPEASIAKKGDLLFSDDFESATPAKQWHKVVPTFAFEKGALKGTQTRDKTTPAVDGKPAVTAHAAVHGLDIPTKDSVVEVKFKFDGGSFVSVEFDDRNYTGAHYGHICFARVTPTSVTIADQKEGSMRNDIYAMSSDPTKKDERNKLLAGKSATFPVKLENGKWYTLVVETVGDSMRASIDGKAVAFLKSPGIAHPTKSKIELGCGGKDGWFDDIKVWAAEPAKL
jgi:hypothetical protein